MKKFEVAGGMNRRAIDRIIRACGGSVQALRRTGEVMYRHPRIARPVRINGRRKDAPQVLVDFALQVVNISTPASNDEHY